MTEVTCKIESEQTLTLKKVSDRTLEVNLDLGQSYLELVVSISAKGDKLLVHNSSSSPEFQDITLRL